MPKFLPSWLQALVFNFYLVISKKNKFYFSLDRVTCPDIYRAGDGVHKVFLTIEKKSKLNLLHPVYLYLERHCFENAKYIIANSKMVKRQIINSYNLNEDKIKIIYNGIELKDNIYSDSFDKLSKEFLIEKNQFIILFVGSGFKRKGVEEFLKIFSKLKTRNIKAFILGKDKNSQYYLNLSEKLEINSKVIFTGERQDVDDFYSIGDILLFPTHYDPFSNVVIEAMNFENAVFTTKNNGASEILDKTYIMDSPTDFQIASKIDSLLSNKTQLKKIKKDNKKISKLFSIENNLKETLEVINQFET